jgi:alkylhydroperoxidase family enzyme
MEPRIDHPAQTIAGAMEALQSLEKATQRAGVPPATQEMIRLRAGQINGCSGCVDIRFTASPKRECKRHQP